MAKDVKVVIELTKAPAKAGFGFPLILAANQEKAVAYKEVSSLGEVVTAGFAETTAVYKAAKLLFMQNDAPSTIAVCAATEGAETALNAVIGNGWRQLVVVDAADDVESISDYIESSGKHAMYFASVKSTDTATLTAIKGNERTVAVVYDSTDEANPEAAVVGATAGLEVGSFTYKNIVVKGVTAQELSDSEVSALHEAGAITILLKAGYIVTSEGVTASGEYADIVDSKDYIIEQIEYQCQSLMIRVPKLPYDNRGIASLEAVVVSVLMDAANNGMIAQNEDGDYAYTVNFGARSECSASDISARHYEAGQFSFEQAGAIHTAEVTGSIIA